MLARIANPYAPKLDCIDIAHGRDGRVLVLSMRKVADLVGYTAMYEFEDIVADVTGADLATVSNVDALEWPRRRYKLARHFHRLARGRPSPWTREPADTSR